MPGTRLELCSSAPILLDEKAPEAVSAWGFGILDCHTVRTPETAVSLVCFTSTWSYLGAMATMSICGGGIPQLSMPNSPVVGDNKTWLKLSFEVTHMSLKPLNSVSSYSKSPQVEVQPSANGESDSRVLRFMSWTAARNCESLTRPSELDTQSSDIRHSVVTSGAVLQVPSHQTFKNSPASTRKQATVLNGTTR